MCMGVDRCWVRGGGVVGGLIGDWRGGISDWRGCGDRCRSREVWTGVNKCELVWTGCMSTKSEHARAGGTFRPTHLEEGAGEGGARLVAQRREPVREALGGFRFGAV